MGTSYYHYDALGSTRELTNSAGDVTDTYAYNAWGEEVAKTGVTINPFRWIGNLGYYYDGDTGNYYVRARSYSPTQARWLSIDPIGYEGSKWNLYEYVDGMPVKETDPTGESLHCTGKCSPSGGFLGLTKYGCFCGKGARGTSPIDPMDRCCQTHDGCYGQHNCDENKPEPEGTPCGDCDKAFCRCLKISTCNRWGAGTPEWVRCEQYRRLAMGYFHCEERFGIPSPKPPIA